MNRGKFITLEGIEGAGKSTVARFVCESLRARGLSVLATREPGGTPLAERVRQIVLERGTESLSPVTETLLMFAARALHVDNVIRPALPRRDPILCDPSPAPTPAYHGSARRVPTTLTPQLAQAVHGDLAPDLTLLLDLPVAAGLARARARTGAVSDRFEAETVTFFEKVRAGYLAIARGEPARVQVIDAAAPLEEVEHQVSLRLALLSISRALA